MAGKIDLSQCWNDALKLLSGNRETLIAIAGVFQLLPSLAFAFFVDAPAAPPEPTLAQILELSRQFYADNWYWMLLIGLITGFGALVMQIVVLDRQSPTVGEAMRIAGGVIPVYFIANILSGFAIMLGALLFLLPGIYIFVKFVLAAPVVAMERQKSPFAVLGRSWRLTKGNGLNIFIFVVVILLTASILTWVIGGLFGALFSVALSDGLAETLIELIDGVIGMAMFILTNLVLASLYLNLTRLQQEAGEA